MTTYKIVRFYQKRDDRDHEIITRGLTLEQAQKHCSHPETSSSTAKGDKAIRRTKAFGPWFDGYTEE